MIKDMNPEEAGRWFEAAPKIVQDSLQDPAVEWKVVKIGEQYGLHIDTTDTLIKLTNLLLIGYIDSKEFVSSLTSEGIGSDVVQKIIVDINQEIFTPIQMQMRTADQEVPRENTSSRPVVPVPRYAPAQKVKSPTVNTPAVARPTMVEAQSNKILPDHMLPLGEEAPSVQAQKIQPPSNLPGVMPSTRPVVAPISKPAVPTSVGGISNRPQMPPPIAPKIIPSVPKSPSKSYGVDPYREPIDEV